MQEQFASSESLCWGLYPRSTGTAVPWHVIMNWKSNWWTLSCVRISVIQDAACLLIRKAPRFNTFRTDLCFRPGQVAASTLLWFYCDTLYCCDACTSWWALQLIPLIILGTCSAHQISTSNETNEPPPLPPPPPATTITQNPCSFYILHILSYSHIVRLTALLTLQGPCLKLQPSLYNKLIQLIELWFDRTLGGARIAPQLCV